MKLFVWNQPYSIPYGGSIAYAVAETEEEARERVRSARALGFGEYPREGAVWLDIDRPPDRVLSAPCAEIYEWVE